MKTEFTTKEVGKVLGVTSQLMEDWISRGLIKPDLQEGAGAGSKRLFSLKGLHQAALAFQLKKTWKVDRETIKHLMKACQACQACRANWSGSVLMIMADIDAPKDQPQPVVGLFPVGFKPNWKNDFRTVINLSSIVEWVSKRVQEEGIM